MKIAKIGVFSLICTGVGSMIGSGWLFSSYYAAQKAGPAAILAWIIAAILVTCLALGLSELISLCPKRGLLTRILAISHGKDFAFICSLSSWLGIIAVIPTEAEASVQYLSNLSPTLLSWLWDSSAHHLSPYGIGLSILFLLFYFILNYWGIKLFAKSNIAFTILKITIPTFVAFCLAYSAFHPENFTYYKDSFIPYGKTAIFTTIISSGIIYSFNGFQSIVAFAAEAKNPKKNIPIALISSILITLVIYLILQTVFIGSIPTSKIISGWSNLQLHSPLVELASFLSLNYLVIILYLDSAISPSGTGLIFTATSTRMLTAMSQEQQMPAYFNKIERHLHFSRRSLCFNLGLSIILLFFFRSWHSLVNLISLFHIISYFPIPLSLAKLRLSQPNHSRLFTIPYYQIAAPLLFIFLSFLFLAAQAPNTLYCLNVLSIFYIIYYLVQTTFKFNWPILKNSSPIIIYLALLTLLDNLSPPSYQGNGTLNNFSFYLLAITVALSFYYYAIYIYKEN